MSTVWIVPLVVLAVALPLLAWAMVRLAEEAAAFRDAVARLGELRPALVEVRTGLHQLRRR